MCLPLCWRAAVCVQQDICCVRGAPGGRVLPAEECRQSGRKGHTHHSQTGPHVPPPPLGAQRWGPLHRRERQTCARHTQVTAASLLKHSITHVMSLNKRHAQKRVPRGHSHLHNIPHTLCTNYMHWLFCLFVCLCISHHILFSLTLSLPMLGLTTVCPVQCFQRRSRRQCHRWWQQKVIIIPLQYSVHGDGVLAFFPSRSDVLTLYNVTSDPWHPLSFITTEKLHRCQSANVFLSLYSQLWWRKWQRGSV